MHLVAGQTPVGRCIRLQLVGHRGWLESVAWSPDGRLLLSGGADGIARIWNAKDGTLVGRIIGDPQGQWTVVDAVGRFETSDPLRCVT